MIHKARFLGVAAALAFSYVSAAAVECPIPQPTSRPGVIPELAVKVEDLSALLESGDRTNRIGVIVHNLKQNYPNAENSEIISYLVTSFCPVVMQLNGLGEVEKQAQMDQFTRQVVNLVY